jgi:hypothetical protein
MDTSAAISVSLFRDKLAIIPIWVSHQFEIPLIQLNTAEYKEKEKLH